MGSIYMGELISRRWKGTVTINRQNKSFLNYLVSLFVQNLFKWCVGGTHFHMNNFSQRFVLAQRQKPTRNRPIRALLDGIHTTIKEGIINIIPISGVYIACN